jgi:hypothetical protein
VLQRSASGLLIVGVIALEVVVAMPKELVEL